MKKYLASYLFLIAGIINVVTSIFSFSSNKPIWGFFYVFLATTFITLGVYYRRKQK